MNPVQQCYDVLPCRKPSAERVGAELPPRHFTVQDNKHALKVLFTLSCVYISSPMPTVGWCCYDWQLKVWNAICPSILSHNHFIFIPTQFSITFVVFNRMLNLIFHFYSLTFILLIHLSSWRLIAQWSSRSCTGDWTLSQPTELSLPCYFLEMITVCGTESELWIRWLYTKTVRLLGVMKVTLFHDKFISIHVTGTIP